MNFKLKAGAFAPIRAHKQDAGVDLLSPVTVTIYPGDSATIDTGVCAEKSMSISRLVYMRTAKSTNMIVNTAGMIMARIGTTTKM